MRREKPSNPNSIARFPFAYFSLFPDLWDHAYAGSCEAVLSLLTIITVHLGDGVTAAKTGERLDLSDMGSGVRWTSTFANDDRPTYPPMLVSGREWRYIGPHPPGCYESPDPPTATAAVVERRHFHMHISEDVVVVLREGMAFPTRQLISVVNEAHAVVVVRGGNDYFYLRGDFVLSAREEEELVEWGVRRPLFANSLLAVGGTLLVAIVEKAWEPAVVGTLLVAAAEYHVQGALTKVLRVRSLEWKSKHKLVPSGIHGTERAVQGMLLTLVALADLLNHRGLLLTALICASVQVVLLEYVGQSRLTWGHERYNSVLRLQLRKWTGVCTGLVAWLWLAYLFACFFFCFLGGLVVFLVYMCLMPGCLGDWSRDKDDYRFQGKWVYIPVILVFFGGVGVGIGLAVVGWDDADLKFSPQSLQPWRWPLLRAPDSFSTGVRIVGLWVGALVGCFIAVYIVVGVLSFRISSDGVKVVGLDERTLAREREGAFRHYDESSIPSRNLLVPYGQQAPDVGQQTLDYFWGDVGVGQQAPDVGQQTPDVGQQPAPFSSAV